MNIFFLSEYPRIAAAYLCDQHVVKMTLESAQMMSTAFRLKHGDTAGDSLGIYKKTHINHPMNVWVRSHTEDRNYVWLYYHFCGLLEEYERRFKKTHGCEKLRDPLSSYIANILIESEPTWYPARTYSYVGFDRPPLCMPEEYHDDDFVLAYRRYYTKEKIDKFARYKHGVRIPFWVKDRVSYGRS